jgi:hypothetical protein
MDVTENGLRAAVKALTDVVAPAVNPADPLAAEQLRLVVDYLEFVRKRLDFLYDRDRFELGHNLSMAQGLDRMNTNCSAATKALLAAAMEEGRRTLDNVGASTPALKSTSAALAAGVRELVREAASFDATVRTQVERYVLDASEERITFERAWYLPLGFDPAANEVPSIATILAGGGAGISRTVQ